MAPHSGSASVLAASPSTPGQIALPDSELIHLAARDDNGQAFQTLFERHRDSLQGFLYRKLRNMEDAEDALSLTFYKAWRSRSTFRGSSAGKAWIYQIASRIALDILRSRHRHSIELELDALEPDALEGLHDPDQVLDPEACVLESTRLDSYQELLDGALSTLSPEELRLLRLFYFDGFDYEGVCSVLGLTRTMVKSRLHRIRTRLRRTLMPASGVTVS